MREENRPGLSNLSKKTTYSSENVYSIKCKDKKNENIYQELIKIRPVSIHIKRLQWNDVIKKQFTSKYRLIRPCVSQISRQLLNFELRKKMKFIKDNHVLESKKVISKESATETDSLPPSLKEYPSISYSQKMDSDLDMTKMKIKACEVLSNSAEPPLKKFKRNEDGDNFFIGFDSGFSPTKSLIKLKTVHLKKYKGLERRKTEAGSLQYLSTRPVLCTNSDFSLKPTPILDSDKDSYTVCNSKLSELSNFESAALEVPTAPQNAEPKNLELLVGSNHVMNKSETNANDNTNPNSISVKYVHSQRNSDLCEKFTNAKTYVNCVARKHTSKPSIKCKMFKSHGPVTRVYVGNSSINNCNITSVKKVHDGNHVLKCKVISEAIIPVLPKKSNRSDSDSDTISACDSVKSLAANEECKVVPSNYITNTPIKAVNQDYSNENRLFKFKSSNSQQDQFTDSDSNTTIDSLDELSSSDLCDSSDEDSNSEAKPFVDLSKFLTCDVNLTSVDKIFKSDNDIIYKSQNIQLKSHCQVKVYMLKASDITDTFCRNNQLSGVSGFKLRQLLCTVIHLPQNGYGNFIIEVEEDEEEEEEETIKMPHFLTIPDPFIHSIFSLMIKRDMRLNHFHQSNLLDIITKTLGALDTSTSRAGFKIRAKPVCYQHASGNFLASRPSLVPSKVNFVPFSSANSNSYRMTLISPQPASPNFPHNMRNGGPGNLILLQNGMGTASGSTLIFQQPNNLSGACANSSKLVIGQSSQVAPPPLTLGSDLVRPGVQGQQLSLSQPPTLTRMMPQLSPIIYQNPQPHQFQNWPIGHLQHPYIISTGPVVSSISCPNHKLEFYQLQSIIRTVVDNIKALIRIGFQKNQTSIMNAAFQMLYSNNLLCCKFHSISAANSDEPLQNLLLNLTGSTNHQFIELPLPSPPQCHDLHPWSIPNNDMLIVKRFVFAVDKSTRTITYPLPPSCFPKDNDSIDKITVVIMISALRGLGPGLIVFPHSLLRRNLLLSLESASPYTSCGKDWVLSAHQRGGLTQSMLLEYLEECALWVNQSTHGSPPALAVDWWWCLEQQMLSSTFKTLEVVKLHEKYALYKDPLEISIGVTMERMWGLLVRKFSQTFGPLTEPNFPKFIIQVLKDLCGPNRLIAWCRSSGLYPRDIVKAEEYNKHITAII